MKVWDAVKALYLLGGKNIFLTLKYGPVKSRMERKAGLKKPLVSLDSGDAPGKLLKVEELEQGRAFEFENATAEVVFLAADVVRITWQPGKLPVPYTVCDADWPDFTLDISESQGQWCFSTSEMTLQFASDGSVKLLDKDGKSIRQEDPPLRQGDVWKHSAALHDEERIFGLGQRNHALNLRGGTFRLWNTEPLGDYGHGKDPIYLSVPVYSGVHENGSYLAYYENSFFSAFSFNEKAEAVFNGGALRYYLSPGPLTRSMARYSQLTGRPAMPPKWALGYHQSRWSYLNQEQVREVVEGFEKNDMPLGALHLDIHYMDGYRVFTVDKERFPDLAKLSGELSERGVKLVAINDIGVKVDPEFEVYKEGVKGDMFCRLPDGQLATGPVWPGTCAFPDFTDPKAREWWGAQYKTFVDWGLSGIWHDMNEPAVFAIQGYPTLPRHTQHELDGAKGDHDEAHNLYALQENRAAYESLKLLRKDKRPWLLTRSGWAGIQRYAWNWTGDCGATWWTLSQSIKQILMLSLSGVPYTGPDIGGFNGDPTAELYTRWMQAGAFFPFFRTHSAVFVKRREPWSLGEPTTSIVREYMKLRYKLMPYWYTLAWETSKSGIPLVRPLWWNDEGNKELLGIEDQFMLGDSIMVAPIVEEGARSREVYLPEGRWFDFFGDAVESGGRTIKVDAPLERIPVYVKAGSVVPMEEDGRLVLHLYLDEQMPSSSQQRIYSDAGDGYGDFRIDELALVKQGSDVTLERKVEGSAALPYNGVDVQLHGMTLKSVVADGKALECNAERRFIVDDFNKLVVA